MRPAADATSPGIEVELGVRYFSGVGQRAAAVVHEPHPEAIGEVWPAQAVLRALNVDWSAAISWASHGTVIARVWHVIVIVSDLLREIVHCGLLSELLTIQ